jgi:heptosyltransferase-2
VNRLRPEETRKLLIRGTNWVGDAVMSVPAMRAIRKIYSQARIYLLIRPWVRDVYAAVDFIDEIVVYDKENLHRGWGGKLDLIMTLRRQRFDAAILLQNAFEAAFIAWSAGIPCRIGYARDGRGILLTHSAKIDPAVHKKHQAYYYLGILSAVGLLPERPWEQDIYSLRADIGICEADRISAKNLLEQQGIEPGQQIVGLNPGAAFGGAKRWLADRYAAVGDALVRNQGVRIVIFGSSADRDIAEQVAASMISKPIVLAGKTSLGQLMALLKECRLLITNDSGPMHLAAALGVPQLAIFGSTNEQATGPLSDRAEVIKNPVHCSPCLLRECPTDFCCMSGIGADRVLEAAEAKLKAC